MMIPEIYIPSKEKQQEVLEKFRETVKNWEKKHGKIGENSMMDQEAEYSDIGKANKEHQSVKYTHKTFSKGVIVLNGTYTIDELKTIIKSVDNFNKHAGNREVDPSYYFLQDGNYTLEQIKEVVRDIENGMHKE